jgi:hypothetical protein
MGWKRCRGADNDDMLGGASDRRAYADDRERERERKSESDHACEPHR